MKIFNFALIGRSGCGKGTQANLLMKHFGNLFKVSTGDMLRNLAGLDTSAGKAAKKILDSGGLIPDFMIIGLWMRELCLNLREDQGILFDGALRRLIEAKQADDFLDFINKKDNFFPILLDISREEAFNRLTKRRICKKCGKIVPWVGDYKNIKECDACGRELENRKDDNPESINNRLDFFDKEVMQVINYYKQDNRLIVVNGEQSIDDVFKDILKAINK
jgi:adenylate kinase